MSTNPKHPVPGHESKRAMHRVFSQGPVVLVVLGLGFVFWQSAINPQLTTEPKPAASAQDNIRLHPAGGSRVKPPDFSPANAEKRRWERLRATFLCAQSMDDTVEQSAALDRYLKDVTPDVAAILLADFKPEELKGSGAERLFDHWATINPSEAVAWAQNQGDPETRQTFLNIAALRWTVVDLKSAANWARSLPEGNARTEIMAAVGSEAVRSDPFEALRMGLELPASPARADLIVRASAEWATTDRDSALEWAKQIEDNDLRQQVTGQMVAAFANQDPVRAAVTARQEMVPGVEQDRAVVTIIQHWVQSDPEDAAAWVSRFPDDSLAQDAIESLVKLWVNQDLAGPGTWLKSLPPSAMRDSGVLAYSQALHKSAPELAKQWAASVVSPIEP